MSSFLRRSSVRMLPAITGIAVLILATPAASDRTRPPAPYAYRQLEDPRQEARAKALMEELRCLVCQGQSIADSDAELAGDMRSLVRERIKSGESPERVRGWLIERYGNWVSYAPPFAADTAFLWLAPVLLLIVGAWLASRQLKRRRRG